MLKLKQSFNKKYRARGFSLVEVIISTIVMTMLMVSTIAYIQYGGKIWQDGHDKITGVASMRTAMEVIRRDLQRANDILEPVTPLPGAPPVATATLTYRIYESPGHNSIVLDENILRRENNLSVATMAMNIARNVSVFEVTRISSWTLQIHIQIQGDQVDQDGLLPVIASETVIFLAPGAG